VAIDEDRVVGTIWAREYIGDTAKLRRMFVQKGYQGTDLAKKLLDIALQFAKEMGYTKITLNTHINMKRANAFYKKNNFTHVGNKNDQMMTFERKL
jgi:GNAT superfamily N-acetyltransferase